MKKYIQLLRHIQEKGTYKDGIYSTFGGQVSINLMKEFPINAFFTDHILRQIIRSAIDVINGGDTFDFYGSQARSWVNPHTLELIDQLSDILSQLRKNPDSRRLIISSWNSADIASSQMEPNVPLIQFYVITLKEQDRKKFWAELHGKHESFTAKMDTLALDTVGAPKQLLSCQIVQSHANAANIPYTSAFFAFILIMIAKAVEMTPHMLVHSFGEILLKIQDSSIINEYIISQDMPSYVLSFNPPQSSIDSFKESDFCISTV